MPYLFKKPLSKRQGFFVLNCSVFIGNDPFLSHFCIMKKIASLSILFFILQVFFVLWGKDIFGQYLNPYGLFIAYFGLAYCYFISIFHTDFTSFSFDKFNISSKLYALALSLSLFALCIPAIRSLFSQYLIPDVIKYSDVLPLIIKQYDLFALGETPYQAIAFPFHTAYPAYMPFHWLPIGISRFFGKDPRWAGLFLLVLVCLLFVFYIANKHKNSLFTPLLILLPTIIVYVFIIKAGSDIAITFETVIAAYYFLLAIALMQKNFVMVIIGIILCLLSRYTLVFWLPLFFLLLLFNKGFLKTALSLGVIVVAVFLVFVYPFLLKNPSLLVDSLAYHNNAAIADWSEHKYSFEWGVYFGNSIDFIVKGTPSHKVFIARIIQASTMLFLLFLGLFLYRKNKSRASFYDILLGMLYATIIGFYMLGPFAFRYYMLGPLFISLVLLARILLAEDRGEASRVSLESNV